MPVTETADFRTYEPFTVTDERGHTQVWTLCEELECDRVRRSR